MQGSGEANPANLKTGWSAIEAYAWRNDEQSMKVFSEDIDTLLVFVRDRPIISLTKENSQIPSTGGFILGRSDSFRGTGVRHAAARQRTGLCGYPGSHLGKAG